MTHYAAEMDRICSAAQARMDAGEPQRRHIPLAYTPPPGDSSLGNLPWMTEDEAAHLAELRLMVICEDSAWAAASRITARIVHRKAQKLSMSGATCSENGGIST